MTNYKDKLHPIRAFVFDFDGVMTDGSVWTYGDRETVRAGNSKDGYAVQYAVKQGYISHAPGGRGCVRDIIEQVLRLHNKWFQENALEW